MLTPEAISSYLAPADLTKDRVPSSRTGEKLIDLFPFRSREGEVRGEWINPVFRLNHGGEGVVN